ncbi:hypothetical protein LTR84_012745 [Exophiala bonariae]|uniref:Extracellular mutant protein 11 C-terminal domain-containing protein n=1 Tax=Exophiala bonariae TaxID=1690606 RepID=A0AAV9NF86_9EURO|nr:hypothetical protein LTR84_012745 [Exophiala bonariae]
MNSDSALNQSLPTNEGQQSETPILDVAPSTNQSQRPRHNSSARKRTNDEIYGPVQTPVKSPKTARFDKSNISGGMSEPASQPSDGKLVSGQVVQTSLVEEERKPAQKAVPVSSLSDKPSHSFVQDIKDYQQELELEFQTFERSLEERDPSTDLEDLDWNDLEERYKNEIQPHMDSEQEIMIEFGSRFQQFMLYMQVCNDQESERAIKRLRTRIAVVQNSEQSLAQKQEHHTKVLEAFQSAMALLGKLS